MGNHIVLTRAQIEAKAADFGFRVVDLEPTGVGRQIHVTLKDEDSDDKATIAIWPTTTDSDLAYLLTRAVFELRGYGGPANDNQHEWMM